MKRVLHINDQTGNDFRRGMGANGLAIVSAEQHAKVTPGVLNALLN